MTVLGHGVDIVAVARVARSIDEHGERFLARVFTDTERAHCEDSAKRRFERYAARFAAKEAALKCLGTGWSGGIAWTDVSVRNDASGAPNLDVTGRAREVAEAMAVSRWLVSLSHTEGMAIASVMALGEA